jgi:Ca2+:H+ antiporter
MLPSVAEIFASYEKHPAHQIYLDGIVLSDFIAVMLLLGYLASILFSVFRVGDKPGDEEADNFDPTVGERSAAAIMRLLAYRHHIAKSEHADKTSLLGHIDNTVAAIMDHEVATPPGGETKPVAQTSSPAVALPDAPAAPLFKRVTAPLPLKPKKVEAPKEPKPALVPALILLAVATIGVGYLSDILVGSIEPLTQALHWNPAFVGLVFIPLIGGLPEYFNTISMALNKRMGMVLAASAGSSIQIALLMAPILVLLSMATPMHLDLVFSIVELAVLALATFLFSEITRDGELVWLEGLLLILLYFMMAGTVFIFGS